MGYGSKKILDIITSLLAFLTVLLFAFLYANAVFGFGMCGSPLPLWAFHDSFVAQIAGQGMGADYLATLETAANPGMLVAMFAATFVAGLIGAYIARGMFKKHFVKAGLA